MAKKFYSDEDLEAVAMEVIDMLRPKHLRIRDIKIVVEKVEDLLQYVVLKEKE